MEADRESVALSGDDFDFDGLLDNHLHDQRQSESGILEPAVRPKRFRSFCFFLSRKCALAAGAGQWIFPAATRGRIPE